MPVQPVQVSMDTDLLTRIDRDPEVRERGRSAFIRSAIEMYLAVKERQKIDRQIVQAYAGEADAILAETGKLMDAQAWPDR